MGMIPPPIQPMPGHGPPSTFRYASETSRVGPATDLEVGLVITSVGLTSAIAIQIALWLFGVVGSIWPLLQWELPLLFLIVCRLWHDVLVKEPQLASTLESELALMSYLDWRMNRVFAELHGKEREYFQENKMPIEGAQEFSRQMFTLLSAEERRTQIDFYLHNGQLIAQGKPPHSGSGVKRAHS